MTEEKDICSGSSFLELRGFVGKYFTGGAVFEWYFKSVRVLEFGRVE